MTMSRMAVLVFVAALSAPASAAPMSAEEAIEAYRKTYGLEPASKCGATMSPEEVLVCGRREGPDPNRIPYQPEPGARVPGEPLGAVGCIRLCRQPVQLDLIKAAPAIVNGIRRILGRDD